MDKIQKKNWYTSVPCNSKQCILNWIQSFNAQLLVILMNIFLHTFGAKLQVNTFLLKNACLESQKEQRFIFFFVIVNLKIHAKPLFFLTLIKYQSIQHSFTNLRAYDKLVQSLICMVILNTYKVISYNFRLKRHKGKYLIN